MTRPSRLGFLVTLAAGCLAGPASGQVATPAPPEKYNIYLRYQARTGPEERIIDYRALTGGLKALGFVETPREDADLDLFDPTADRLAGTIPAANARRAAADPLVRTILLAPAGYDLPADATKPVEIRLALPAGLDRTPQRELHRQTARHLGFLGFREAVGYDHAGFTALRGTVPAGNLFTLLKDLRTQPAGWFAPAVPLDQLPAPFRNVLPVRLVEVLPDLPAAVLPPAAPPLPPAFAPAATKLTPGVVAAASDPASAGKPVRVELVLFGDPAAGWTDLRNRLRTSAVGTSIDGLVGPVVSIRVARPDDVAALAANPEVRAVRLPQPGVVAANIASGGGGTDPAAWLSASRLADLHRAGYQGDGRTIVVIAPDFAGPGLPADARLLDLTAELDPNLVPAPAPAGPSVGTPAAQLARLAAPRAALVLVRVDPSSLHQVLTVARAATGDPTYSEAQQARVVELGVRRDLLAVRRRAVEAERTRALADLSDDATGPARVAAADAAFSQLQADEAALAAAGDRLRALKAGLDGLRQAAVVVNTLTWSAGYPQDGLSELSRFLEANLTPPPDRLSRRRTALRPERPVWVQAAGASAGTAWAGALLDADQNGVMEFAPPDSPVPAGRWSRELNFLTFTPAGAADPAAMPAGAKVRVTVQWREPLPPDGVPSESPALVIRPRLLRQLDPAGKTLASDEFADAPALAGPAIRLLRTPGSAAYEQTLEATLPAAGVYALRVEVAPAAEGLLSSQRPRFEVSPRIVVGPADAATAAQGTITFATYATPTAGVGIPGDSPAVLTIGATPDPGRPSVGPTGGGPGVALRIKPDLTAPGRVAVGGATLTGPAASAALVAGGAASLAGAGVRAGDLIRTLGLTPGQAFELPPEWLRSVAERR